jgi:hypothetical protein
VGPGILRDTPCGVLAFYRHGDIGTNRFIKQAFNASQIDYSILANKRL